MKKRILVFLMATAVAVSSLAGCSTTKESGKQAEETEESIFKMAVSYIPDSLIPETGNSIKMLATRPLYEQLYLESSSGKNYILAKSFESSEDGMEYKLCLNEDAAWSDGEPITIEDVLFTMDYLEYTKGSSNLKQVNGKDVTFNEVDDHTLEITLPEKNVLYDNGFSLFTVIPAHLFDGDPSKVDGSEYFTDPEKIVTSGPFKVEEINADSMVYIARDDYFRGKPQVDKIYLSTLGEGVSEQVAFENGDLSYMRLTTKEDIEKYESEPDKYNVYTLSESRTGYLQLNPKGSVLSELGEDARKAIFLALDINEIIDIAEGSERIAVPANSLMNPDQVVYDKDCHGYEQDLELAKELAKSSGLEGKTLTYVYCSDRVNMEETATVVQQQLSKIGVNLVLEGLDTSTFFSTFFYPYNGTEADWDMGTNGWGDMRGDRVREQVAYFTNPAWGWSQDFIDLVSSVNTITDSQERKAVWKDIQSEALEEYWEYPMEYSMCAMVSHKNVTGLDESLIIPEFADWMTIKVE